MSWGFVELGPDQMKRTKNARRMHMCFHVQSGVVQVKVHENQFLVHRGGVWQVPRGKCSLSYGHSLAFYTCIGDFPYKRSMSRFLCALFHPHSSKPIVQPAPKVSLVCTTAVT